MKRFAVIVLRVILGLLLVALLLAAFSQTQLFRNRLRALALSNLQSFLTADVYLGELRGNLIAGFSIDSLSVTLDGIPIVATNSVELRYNIFGIPGKTLSLSTLTLDHPTLRLLRSKDGRWNVARMIRPLQQDTTRINPEPPTTPWTIDLHSLEIKQGLVLLVDSTALRGQAEDAGVVDYRNFMVRNVNLAMAGRVTREEKDVSINKLSFDLEDPSLHLKSLTCEARINNMESEVKNLHIVTDRSDISLSATLKNVDLLGGFNLRSLRHSPVAASLTIGALDFKELRRFIPSLRFLDGDISGNLAVKGEFGRLEVTRLDLRHGKTNLALKGVVGNLHDPSDLTLDVRMDENTIDAEDLQVLLPGLELPDLKRVGVATLSLQYRGKPLDFGVSGALNSKAGSVRISDVVMHIGGPRTLAYSGSILFRDLDLAALSDNPSLESRLTGSVVARGEGVGLRTMIGSIDVALDSSRFHDEAITRSWLSLAARDRRILGRLQLSVGPTSGQATAMLDESRGLLPTFSLSGTVEGLNLRRFVNDPSYDSDISMSVDASGSGLTWKDLDGTLLADFSRSRYRNYTLDSAYLQLTATAVDSAHKLLSIGSPVLDAVVDGQYDLPSLSGLLSFEADNIMRELRRKLAPVDSSLRPAVGEQQFARTRSKIARTTLPANVEFTIQLKNLEPLSEAIGGGRLTGVGMVTGEIRGGLDTLAVKTDLQIEEFAYGNEEQGGIFVDRANVSVDVQSLTPSAVFDDAQVRCTASVAHLAINRTVLDSLRAELNYGRNIAVFLARTTADSDRVEVETAGQIKLKEDTVAMAFDRFEAAYEGFRWAADPGAIVELTGTGLKFREFHLKRGLEHVSVAGSVAAGGSLNVSILGSELDLDALKYILRQERPGVRRSFFSGIVDVSLDASGTLIDPQYHALVRARNVQVRGMQVGSVNADLTYAEKLLQGNIESIDLADSGRIQLTAKGVIPMNLALTGVEGKRVGDGGVDIALHGDRFQLAVFDPFLPAFEDFQGLMSCDLRLRGALGDPQYEGTINVSEGSFLFAPNNIRYEFGGAFRAAGSRFNVEGVTVRNVDEDTRAQNRGTITIGGDLSLKNFRPGDFNLSLTGDLLVVKEATRSSSLEVSGELFTEIGPGGLKFTGEIERSLLKGDLIIRNSTLVLPPSQAQVGEQSATSVPVLYVDDTTRVVATKRRAVEQYFTGRNGRDHDALAEDERPSVSFIDGMKYDLNIETTGGSTTIELIFNSLTAEKLVATINGRFSIRGEKSHWVGDLTISQAYYNFLKRFEAEGKIRYTGDFLNPELDITASYQSRRTVQDSTGRLDEKVVVIFKISGTRKEPKIETNMQIDDIDYANYKGLKSNDVQSDAIQFIVYGTFPLTATQRNEANPDLQKQLGASAITGAASMLTGALSEFLRTQTGFINSVDIRYGGTRGAEIRLSGSALNGFWRFGGRFVEEPLANADFSLLYSFEAIFGRPSLRNLMFEFERRVESTSLQLNDLKRVNSARLFYRFSF
jgi:hypothetical protein